MAKQSTERYREFVARQKKRGMVRKTLWVPKDKIDQVEQFIKQLSGE